MVFSSLQLGACANHINKKGGHKGRPGNSKLWQNKAWLAG
jgi:hypothetical protein